jgi:hypothetical protein
VVTTWSPCTITTKPRYNEISRIADQAVRRDEKFDFDEEEKAMETAFHSEYEVPTQDIEGYSVAVKKEDESDKWDGSMIVVCVQQESELFWADEVGNLNT